MNDPKQIAAMAAGIQTDIDAAGLGKPKGSMSVSEAGRRGGAATAKLHGPEFYQKIGRLGGAKLARLIAAGRRAEQEQQP